MPSIDERVVSAAFENAKFEAQVAVTMATLAKLDTAFQAIGKSNSLADIEKAASKVTLVQPMSALDKLKARLAGAGQGADQGLGDIEKAGNKVTLTAPMTALDKLKAHLGTVGSNASDSFSEIDKASNRVDLHGLNSAIDSVTAKFSVLQGAASVALGNIAAQAALRGAAFAKSFALGPVTQGFQEYTTNLNSIQTILANTQSSGGNLETVNAALQELNTYSDKTIYNFSEMAKNIGTFTAAGVKLDTATQSIKGIANLAALSGSNSMQASTAMYQLSQAIAAGKVSLQDWNSVVNAGMGGEVFQKALFNTGKAMGTITNSPVSQTFEEWKKAGNSFRQSLSATQKAAQDGTSQLKKTQKDAAQSVSDAHSAAADAVANAADRVKTAQASSAEAVTNAAKRLKDAQESSAEAVTNAAQKVTDAETSTAEAAKSAADKVKEAHKGVSDATKQSALDLKDAQTAEKETFAQSAESVKSALDSVTEARKRLVEAMKPPSTDELQAAADNLKTAQLDQADLSTAISDAETEQKRSTEDLAAAQKKLVDLQNSGANQSDILSATRAVEDAKRRSADASDAVERATIRQNAATRGLHSAEQDLLDVQQKGSDNDQKVVDARDAVTIATEKYTAAQAQALKDNQAAEDKVTATRLKGIADQKKASEDLAAAEKDQTKVLLNNRKIVADAEKAQAKTIIDSRDAVAEAEKNQAKTIIDSRKSVADAEKDQAKVIKSSRESVAKAEESATERIKTARDGLAGGKATSAPPSWLTSDVLTTTLKQFTGDMTDAQLKAQGFNDEQIKAIQQTAKTAQDSATKVKTLGQVFDVAREAIGSGWATTFQNIFGDFTESRKTFTDLSNSVNGFVNTNSKARNKVLSDWKALGGRAVLFEGIKNIFEGLIAVIKPIKDAFRDIFPAQTGKSLFEMTKNFRDLTETLTPSAKTVDGLRRTFRGLFAILHIGFAVVKGVVGVLFDLLGVAGQGSGGFLGFTGSIGDFLVAIDKALTKGGLLKSFFDTISTILQVPIKLIGQLASAIFGLFGGVDSSKASALGGSLDTVSKAAGPLSGALTGLKRAWDGFIKLLQQAKDLVSPWLDTIGTQMSTLGSVISDAFKNANFSNIMAGLQTAFIGGIFLALKKAITGGASGLTKPLGKLSEVLDGLTGNLKAMQQNIKANTLLQIAAAIGILAVGVLLLSTIEPKKLATALTAVAVGLGELMGAMKLMTSGMGAASILTLPVLAAGVIGMAIAVTILAGAVKIFSTMSWEDIAKGLAGVGGGLAAIGIGMKLLGPTTLIQGPALIGIAIALNLLALAVKQFAGMKWEDLAKGLAGVLGVLVAVAVPLSAMGPSLILVGPGLIAASFGILGLAKAVSAFSAIDPKKMAVGILGMAATLVTLGAAITLIPPTVALQAAGLIVLSIALAGIAGAIALMGNLKIGTILKGLVTLGASLAILAVGLSAMAGTLPGSVALLAAAAALALLAPTLGFMGTLNWGTIFKGLAAMALVLGTLSIVGTVASSGLVSLGIALLPLAGVFVLAAGGIFIFAKALALLGDNGAKGIGVMVTAITAFVALLPTLVITFIQGLVGIIAEVAKIAPQVVVALGTIIDTIIQFVIAKAPSLGLAIGVLVDTILSVLLTNAPKIIGAGIQLLTDFLSGIDQQIGTVAPKALSIVVKFLESIASAAPQLAAAGANVLVQFLGGIATQVPSLVAATIGLVASFIGAIAGQLPKVLLLGATLLVNFISGMASKLVQVVAMGVSAVMHIITGIGNALPKIVTAAGDVIIKFVDAIANVGPKVVDAGFKALIQFLHGIATAIRDNNQDLVDAGVDIATAIAQGLVDGLSGIGGRLIKPAIEKLFGALPGWARKILGIHSPSKVFMEIGKFTAQGMVVGLQQNAGDVATAAGNMGDGAISAIRDSVGKAGDVMSFAGIDSNPTITPVLDLTNVRKGAQEINSIGADTPIGVGSFGMASAISAETQSAGSSGSQSIGGSSTAPLVTFEQTNISPEALPAAEIYRRTQNQLSLIKGALGFVTGSSSQQ